MLEILSLRRLPVNVAMAVIVPATFSLPINPVITAVDTDEPLKPIRFAISTGDAVCDITTTPPWTRFVFVTVAVGVVVDAVIVPLMTIRFVIVPATVVVAKMSPFGFINAAADETAAIEPDSLAVLDAVAELAVADVVEPEKWSPTFGAPLDVVAAATEAFSLICFASWAVDVTTDADAPDSFLVAVIAAVDVVVAAATLPEILFVFASVAVATVLTVVSLPDTLTVLLGEPLVVVVAVMDGGVSLIDFRIVADEETVEAVEPLSLVVLVI